MIEELIHDNSHSRLLQTQIHAISQFTKLSTHEILSIISLVPQYLLTPKSMSKTHLLAKPTAPTTTRCANYYTLESVKGKLPIWKSLK